MKNILLFLIIFYFFSCSVEKEQEYSAINEVSSEETLDSFKDEYDEGYKDFESYISDESSGTNFFDKIISDKVSKQDFFKNLGLSDTEKSAWVENISNSSEIVKEIYNFLNDVVQVLEIEDSCGGGDFFIDSTKFCSDTSGLQFGNKICDLLDEKNFYINLKDDTTAEDKIYHVTVKYDKNQKADSDDKDDCDKKSSNLIDLFNLDLELSYNSSSPSLLDKVDKVRYYFTAINITDNIYPFYSLVTKGTSEDQGECLSLNGHFSLVFDFHYDDNFLDLNNIMLLTRGCTFCPFEPHPGGLIFTDDCNDDNDIDQYITPNTHLGSLTGEISDSNFFHPLDSNDFNDLNSFADEYFKIESLVDANDIDDTDDLNNFLISLSHFFTGFIRPILNQQKDLN